MSQANDRAALTEAVNTLIDDDAAKQMYAALAKILELKRQDYPVELTGRYAALNPLMELAGKDEDAFERVMDLVARKRSERDLPPLDAGNAEKDRRVYMRKFMAAKRDRQRRLIELLNQLRSENDKIKGSARLELERVHAARWLDEKDRREKAIRDESGIRMTADERSQISLFIWAEVDAELDALEEFVRVQSRLPLHQRSASGFQFRVGKMPGAT